jgi:hypothetical protein
MGKYDNTVYFAEVANREDRQKSFEELIEISGIDHYPVHYFRFGIASSVTDSN